MRSAITRMMTSSRGPGVGSMVVVLLRVAGSVGITPVGMGRDRVRARLG